MSFQHIRNFAKFFSNILPSQQREFERVLMELQNDEEITGLASSLDLLGRRPDQRLPIPQLTVTQTIRGATVTWPPLPDQRISFYEIEVSSTSNFAAFTTVTSITPSLTIDGLDETKFIRVRGVRTSGTTTPYSKVAAVTPRLFEVVTHLDEDFYIHLTTKNAQTVVGGIGTDMAYTPINPNAFSMVWGFICLYGDPAVALAGQPSITAKLMIKVISATGSTISDTEYWRNTGGEFWGSYAMGPIAVPHPELNQSLEARIDVQDTTVPDDLNSTVFWAHLNAMELGIVDIE